MKHSMIVVAVLAALLASVGAVQASTLTQTHSTPASAVPFTDGFTLLGAYDPAIGYVPAWGTLVRVDLSLSTSATAQVDVFNGTASAQSFTNAQAVIPVTLTGPLGVQVSTNTAAGPINGTAAMGFNAFSGVTGTGNNTFSDSNLASYAVSTPVSLTASSSNGTYSGTSVPGVFFSGSAVAGGDFSVTYTYAVPEPSTFALLAAGLVGLAVVARRKR